LLSQNHFSRLAGVSFVVPVVNYWWRSLPDRVVKDDYRKKLVRWSMWFANHAPGLLHWWVNQKWLPSTSVLERNPMFFNDRDIDVLKTISGFPMLTQVSYIFTLHKCRKDKYLYATVNSSYSNSAQQCIGIKLIKVQVPY